MEKNAAPLKARITQLETQLAALDSPASRGHLLRTGGLSHTTRIVKV
jgi:hypothetical protein